MSIKQNITAEKPMFFAERQLRDFKHNPRDPLRDLDAAEDPESGYEPDADYEKNVARLIAKKRMIDGMICLVRMDLEKWLFTHLLRPTAELNDGIERDRARVGYVLRQEKASINSSIVLHDLRHGYHSLARSSFLEATRYVNMNAQKRAMCYITLTLSLRSMQSVELSVEASGM